MLTVLEFTEFLKRFRTGGFPHQRFGQAFCNEFKLLDDVLFYEEETGSSIDRIHEKYIRYEE